MIIPRLNADIAAALARDGELIAAAEEERFSGVKHWPGFLSKAIASCLRVKYPAQIVFFLVLLAVGLGLYCDYGISWDEPASRTNGAVTLKYVAERLASSLLIGAESGVESLNTYVDRDYGIAFEAPAGGAENFSLARQPAHHS